MKRICILLLVAGCSSTPTKTSSPPPELAADTTEEPTPENQPTPEQQAEEVAVTVTPVTESSYANLGRAIKSKSENSVLQEASKILSKNSKDLKALNAMAVVYIQNRKLDMAKIVLARAIKAHPNDASLACNLGIVNQLEDKLPEAISEFQRALSLDEGHAEASYHLGAIHARYKNFNTALPLLQQAYAKLSKNIVGPHYAETLRLARKPKDAAEVFESLNAESTRDIGLAFGYASLLVEDIKNKSLGLKMINRIRLLTEDAGILKRADELSAKAESLH